MLIITAVVLLVWGAAPQRRMSSRDSVVDILEDWVEAWVERLWLEMDAV